MSQQPPYNQPQWGQQISPYQQQPGQFQRPPSQQSSYGQQPQQWGQQPQPSYKLSQQTHYAKPPYYDPPQQQLQWLPQHYPPNPIMPPPNKGGFRKKVGPIPLWIFILVIMISIPMVAIVSIASKSNAGTTTFKASTTGLIGSTVGKTIYSFYSPNGATSTSCLKWSPDGSTLQAVRMNGTVQIWDTASWNNTLTYEIPGNLLMEVAWSPMGDYFATVSLMDPKSNAIRVWNTATGENVLTYLSPTSGILALAWSPDGKYIASAGDDNTVQIWNASTGGSLFTYRKHKSAIAYLSWSPDGSEIASADEGNVLIWQTV